MSNYDELIKKAQKEIEKLTAGIEKSKARIAELRANIKELETKKANALEFSDNLVALMNSHGLESEEDRKAVLNKMEEYFQSLAADKSEKAQQTATLEVMSEDENELATETEEPEEPDESEDEPITPTGQNPRSGTTAGYQNPSYPYRPTNNGNFNS